MEKKYVLFGLSPKQIKILAKAEIISDQFILGKESGLAFIKEAVIKATKLLRIKILKSSHFINEDSSTILCLWNYDSKQSLMLSKWDRALLDNADLYIKHYRSKVRVTGAENNFRQIHKGAYSQAMTDNSLRGYIVIDVVHNNTSRVEQMMESSIDREHPEDDLRIYLWASLTQIKVSTPARMWGVTVDCLDESYAPSGKGFAVEDDEGHVVAELVGKNLFIFHDICHHGTNDELKIFQKIIANTPLDFCKRVDGSYNLLFQHIPKIITPARSRDFYPLLKIPEKKFIPSIIGVEPSTFQYCEYEEVTRILKDFAFDFKRDIIFESDEFIHDFETGSFILCPLEKLDEKFSTKLFISSALDSKYLSPTESYYLKNLLENDVEFIDLFSIGERAIYLDNLPIAGVDKNVIFIPNPETLTSELLRFILSEAKDYFFNFGSQSIRRGASKKDISETVNALQEAAGASIINYLNGKNTAEIIDLKKQKVLLGQEIRDLKGAWIAKRRLQITIKKNIDSFTDYQKNELERELSRLLSLKKIRSFGLSVDSLFVSTNYLYFTEQESGDKFKLGRMIININFNNGEVRFHNKTRQVIGFQGEKMHHPHVFLKGNACFGSIESAVAEFIATYRVYDLIMLLIAFLESVNPADSAGKYYRNWPEL